MTAALPLNNEVIKSRLAEIESNLAILQDLKQMPFPEFQSGHSHALAELGIERSLEAVFDIGNHIY